MKLLWVEKAIVALRAASRNWPPSGMASRALAARLSSESSSWFGSARSVQRSGDSSSVRVMAGPSNWTSIGRNEAISARTTTGCGDSSCWRANANNLAVIAAPRFAPAERSPSSGLRVRPLAAGVVEAILDYLG